MISLGVDIGGTGCKCVAFDERGVQRGISYWEYPIASGASAISPEVLKDCAIGVIRECAASLEPSERPAVITVSSFGESFVPVDKAGSAIGELNLYYAVAVNGDFERFVSRAGAERVMDIARVKPDESYSLAGMLAALNRFGGKIAKFLPVASYIVNVLSGALETDVSLACRTMLYDVKGGNWSRELLDIAGIPVELLPGVNPTGACVGVIRREVAEMTGLGHDVKVCIGSHDQIVNALGASVANEGDAVDSCGTCESVTPLFRSILEGRDLQLSNYACVPYVAGSGYVTYAYNNSAGSVVRWYRDSLLRGKGSGAYAEMNASCPEEPAKVMVLPFLQGMGGTPEVDAAATGAALYLTTRTPREEIYRAILEGVTFETRYNREMLEKCGVAFSRLMACGGGSKSAVWLRIKSDILNTEILPVAAEETGAMGSAILGFSAVSGESPLRIAKDFVKFGDPVTPDRELAEFYTERYEIYKKWRSLYHETCKEIKS